MIGKFKLQRVQYMPLRLDPGILYVAEEFNAAAHLCACGCGTIIRTPLNRWRLTVTKNGPSLDPSVGNWQEPCQSHYWIENGQVKWAGKWTDEQIIVGRKKEVARIRKTSNKLNRKHSNKLKRLWQRLKGFF
jgi:hypothetical protein